MEQLQHDWEMLYKLEATYILNGNKLNRCTNNLNIFDSKTFVYPHKVELS